MKLGTDVPWFVQKQVFIFSKNLCKLYKTPMPKSIFFFANLIEKDSSTGAFP